MVRLRHLQACWQDRSADPLEYSPQMSGGPSAAVLARRGGENYQRLIAKRRLPSRTGKPVDRIPEQTRDGAVVLGGDDDNQLCGRYRGAQVNDRRRGGSGLQVGVVER